MKRFLGFVVIGLGAIGCAGEGSELEPYSTRFVPPGVELPKEPVLDQPLQKAAGAFKDCTPIIVAQDYAPWFFGENRVVNSLKAQPFNMVEGVDFTVAPIFALAQGVPECTTAIFIGSNSFGMTFTAFAQRSVPVQAALDDFVQRGGTLAVHLADTASPTLGYLAPGANGTRTQGSFGQHLFLQVSDTHPLRRGFDREVNTADDGTNATFAPLLPFGTTCCATQGSIDTMLPAHGRVVLRDEGGKVVYGEYRHGQNFGRVILTTLTMEWGWAGVFGQSQALLANHLNHVIYDFADDDADLVTIREDCDDNNPRIGERFLDTDFQAGTPELFFPTAQLNDAWVYEDASVLSPSGGQQAMLSFPQEWGNVVISARVSLDGTEHNCCGENAPTNRWRLGVTLRSNLNGAQDEGYTGYRCALAENATGEGGHPYYGESSGTFLQLAEFMFQTEDDFDSECFAGPNVSFEELDRAYQSIADLQAGDTAEINFYAIGNTLICEATDGTHTVRTVAQDDTFVSGTVGLSTLNSFGRFHHVRVCEALDLPIQ